MCCVLVLQVPMQLSSQCLQQPQQQQHNQRPAGPLTLWMSYLAGQCQHLRLSQQHSQQQQPCLLPLMLTLQVPSLGLLPCRQHHMDRHHLLLQWQAWAQAAALWHRTAAMACQVLA